ncbi:MAG: glutamate synthase-related protein, partial [Gammaproteobacteria bacterium]|nr:glutamate synthase-related protein [Gammaproteobacteria bacterium]
INQVNPPFRLEVEQPILKPQEMSKIRNIKHFTNGKFASIEIDITYPLDWGIEGIEAQIASICSTCIDYIHQGFNIFIITDRWVSHKRVAIPALLALSAIHQHLINAGLRTNVGLVVETASAREVHHFALLAGFGAEAICPYLTISTLENINKELFTEISAEKYIENYIKAIGKGLSKIMSKMGVSTFMSYCGSQLFEAIGINSKTIDTYFTGTSSQIEGMDIFDIANETILQHQHAYKTIEGLSVHTLDFGGEYAWRVRGEEHMFTPDVIAKLQHSTITNQYTTYQEFAKLINDQSHRQMTLRGLFEFIFDDTRALPLEEVEEAKEIVKRFSTGAMSLGSISTETHTSLAIAMNRLGGKSNTGEGGEDPERYMRELLGESIDEETLLSQLIPTADVQADYRVQKGDSLRSRIKQVASGRFGVNTTYLCSADQIQIKMAQGAKPGEGGQLPGGKVSEYIGKLRFSVPGVGLISPPPHHDIYSIEDLAQLIYDLKCVNPQASVSVKLVSEVGVGTIAAGVAKCKSDHIVIAGHDGGTGASPWSSIKHAGSPWEIGLAETQQTLVLNRLRGRVKLQVDGQIKTGRDVVIGALLGADEFGFATAPLVTQGCIMMRKCHLNTCPVGVATQDPILRQKFTGKPEYLVNYFFFVAEEVREIMAKLGVRKFDDLIGKSLQYLQMKKGTDNWKVQHLDYRRLFYQPQLGSSVAIYHQEQQNHELDKSLDHQILAKIEHQAPISLQIPIRNVHRSVGALLSGALVRKFPRGLTQPINVQFTGTAGQSFAAFLIPGIVFSLKGDANDYTGKGLSGGCLIVYPHERFNGNSHENIIVGNTVLYGATSGEAYFCGVAGERFAVRLSGASAVVEGVGDHGCEYMTGGTVVVLGATGRNFAAGMSGGVAYVYDENGQFSKHCNTAMVQLLPILPKSEQLSLHSVTELHLQQTDEVQLKTLIETHYRYTHSKRALELLNNWETSRQKFVKVFPYEYQKALQIKANPPLKSEKSKQLA